MTTDESLTLYAAVYDADNNYLQDVSADWTNSGSLNEVNTNNSVFVFSPVSSGTVGTIIISSGSLIGDATGTITVINPPLIRYNSGSINPSAISAEALVSFELGVLNEGDLGVTLDTLSELVITNGQIFYAAKLDEPTFINSGGVSTLSFQENIVPNDLLPGFYTPILNLSGLNEDNSILQQDNLLLDQNSVSIAGVEINDIICADNEVWPGKSDITLEVVFTNESVITLDNFNIDLSFGNYSGDYEQLNTDISTSLSPGEVGSATFIVTVNEEASYGNVTLDANLSANANGSEYIKKDLKIITVGLSFLLQIHHFY